VNCIFFGDWPLEFDFCLKECPDAKRCIVAQRRKYPLEGWRVVAARHKVERWVAQRREEKLL